MARSQGTWESQSTRLPGKRSVVTVPPPGLSRNSDNLEQNQDWNVWIPEPETDREEGVAA